MEKKKILLLTNACTVGGAEMHLLSLAKHLNKDKYDLTLAYLIERPDDARLLKEDFIKTGIKVVDLEAKSRFDPAPIPKIRKLIKDYNFDIVHTHLFQSEIFARVATILNSHPIFITTYHCTEEFLQNPFWARVAKFSIRKFDQVIVISDAVRRYLMEKVGVNEGKIKRIYYGLEAKDGVCNGGEDIKSRCRIGKDDPVIGMIARYAPQKGHKDLLDAMRLVLKKIPETRLFLAGHDEKRIRSSLENHAEQLGVREKVIFSEFRSDVYNLLQQFDLFVLSSLWEGFGLVLLEAMATEKAIVATNVGPIPEIVIDGKTGFLVPPKDPNAMAEKIVFLLKNKKMAEEMGKNGKRRLEKYFTIEKMIRETEAVYDYWLARTSSK